MKQTEMRNSNHGRTRTILTATAILLFSMTISALEIHQASIERNLAKVKELVTADPQLVNCKDERGRTPLMWACGRDQLEIVKFLVENGADVNSLDRMGLSALYYSILNGHTNEIDEILAGHGADVNFSKGNSLLFLAARQGKEKTVELLLKKNADPNLQNSVGKTAIHIAAEYNHLTIVAALLADKADAAIKDNFARTPLHQAAIEGFGKIAELLVANGSTVNEKDNFGRTPLFYAERHGHKKIAEFLQAKGGLSDEHEKNVGYSPLLAKEMEEKEAVIWYLGHTGWAVKTRSKLLIFDYWERGRPDKPLLANGRIDPEEIKDLDVTVFISHIHEDHYDETILDWAKTIKKVSYIFGWKNEKPGQAVSMGPREKKMIGDMEVQLVNSPKADPLDNAFLVKIDGLAIYHAGDYGGLGGITKISDIYKEDMGYLQNEAKGLDIMFLAGLLINSKVPVYLPYTILTTNPSLFFLMHQGANEYKLKALADELAKTSWNSKIIAPMDRGQVYFYTKERSKQQ